MQYDHQPYAYYSNGHSIPIAPVLNILARLGEDDSLSPQDLILSVPHYDINVYQKNNHNRAEQEPERTIPAFYQGGDQKRYMFLTNRFVVQFKPEVTREEIERLNEEFQASIVEELDYLNNGYLMSTPTDADPARALGVANAYYQSDKTLFAHPDLIRTRQPKPAVAMIERPTTENTGDGATEPDPHWHLRIAKVIEAWEISRGTPDITIAVFDQDIDVKHPEFQGKFVGHVQLESIDVSRLPSPPQPGHGTACAGIAAASGKQLSGVAPECTLMAVRTPQYLSVADEAKLFVRAAQNGADILLCPWGSFDGTDSDPMPDIVRAAFRYCLEFGRDGKGTPIFFAAGNGNEEIRPYTYEANPDVIAVAASTSREQKAPYGDHGEAVWVCAPSGGDSVQGDLPVLTTTSNGGYQPFSGTSAAAAFAAGAAALILSVHPNLRERQVREMLARTADQIGDRDAYLLKGSTIGPHHTDFGFGRINAKMALEQARALLEESIHQEEIVTDRYKDTALDA